VERFYRGSGRRCGKHGEVKDLRELELSWEDVTAAAEDRQR